MKFPPLKLSFLLLILSTCLTGCSDMVEIQNRDFVLALGVSYTNNQFELSYALPDISVVTDQETNENEGLIKIYKGHTLPEIVDEYNANSDKRLDYRHLKAIILDDSIVKNESKMAELALYLDNEYDISRNVIVFYSPDKASVLLGENASIGGGIGEYLEKLSSNNQQKNGFVPATAGDLIDGSYNDKFVMIPAIKSEASSVSLNGALLLFGNVYQKELTEAEKNIIQILNGAGTDYIFPISSDYIIRLKMISSKSKYQLENDTPVISYSVSGVAEYLPRTLKEIDKSLAAEEINQYFQQAAEEIILFNLKDEQLDFLNFYRNSSYKNKNIWNIYADRTEDFIKDVEVSVQADIKIQ